MPVGAKNGTKMECTTCHNPHGAQNVKMLREGTSITEACASCHAEKRGPFLWEHAVGRENCVTCHDAARLEQRADAGRQAADALPALPRAQPAPGDGLRLDAGHQQEQPHRRPRLRELPPDDSRLEPSDVRQSVHAVTLRRMKMRTRMMILTGALLLVFSGTARAQQEQAAATTTARRPRPPPSPRPRSRRSSARSTSASAATTCRRRQRPLPALPDLRKGAYVDRFRPAEGNRAVGVQRDRQQRRLSRPALRRRLPVHRQAEGCTANGTRCRCGSAAAPRRIYKANERRARHRRLAAAEPAERGQPDRRRGLQHPEHRAGRRGRLRPAQPP